jgi:hypothetical protein
MEDSCQNPIQSAPESQGWHRLSDEQLLKLRFKDLRLRLDDPQIQVWLQQVAEELGQNGLALSPRFYLGDEWFSPDGEIAIAIPFFLSHPRLQDLERAQMLDCEGDDKEEFLRLLRHEMGHVFDHAFKVSRRRSWQKIFGSNKKPYDPENYRPRAYSKNYVHNIANDYAQAHPDEDFAETFAVWLDPHSNWRTRYRGWGALKKLEYVDQLAKEFVNHPVAPSKSRMPYDATKLSSTLGNYYSKRKKRLAFETPKFFDADLLKIFQASTSDSGPTETAFRFLQRNKRVLIQSLSFWSREKKYVIEQLYSRLQKRARELELRVPTDSTALRTELVAWLSSTLVNYRLTGKWSRRLS